MAGFLGQNESLREVIHEDAETLRKLGLTHGQVADKLEYLVTNPRDSHGFKVGERTYRGCQEDPFQDGRNSSPYSNADFTVKNSAGETISFPGLIIKLIRDYQFFEGKGTSYRLDPQEAVRVLQIKPGEEYNTPRSRPVTQPDKPKIVYRGR
ncbi:hypothetical protein HY496_01235 [Candidatus Woesearchaeota archaeon]|nr:hypothetical protein [Candidatus Woesearchaeota archaeon]